MPILLKLALKLEINQGENNEKRKKQRIADGGRLCRLSLERGYQRVS